ncbi:MAG: AMP-binding protein [Gammaproteobacteria bacterium]|nr:AMP-binding protein [Gammaproteobacteria bacterium]
MSTANQNLFELFFEHFPDDLSTTLLRTPDGVEYSYADAIDESGRMARCLSDLGLTAGDRVTVQVEKSPAVICLYLACLRGGFVFHPLNMHYQLDELVYFVNNAKPSAVVCDPAKQQLFEELTHNTECDVLTLDAAGAGSLSDASAEMPPAFRSREIAADDLAVLLYSSGTTGLPKGAKLSHGNLAANTLTLIKSWGFTADDVLLHALPVYHAHGLFVAVGCVLMSGSSMRFIPKFSADAVIAELPGCTVMMGVPTFYTRLLADPRFDAERTAGMRLFISGSAPLLPETFAAFEERTGHRILERYGMTETSMNASNLLDGERRPGSVGPALPGVELRVVDDADNELPRGEIGHLQVRGPNVFSGYWRMKKESAREFTADGFFRTGDLATIADDDYVTIVGRNKDMIITGGLNVYPREVESVLDELPEVAESAVVGVPHPDFGEGVIAVVVRQRESDISGVDLLTGLRESIASYKLPKQVFTVDALPRNAMGKVQKNRLRETYADAFQSNGEPA